VVLHGLLSKIQTPQLNIEGSQVSSVSLLLSLYLLQFFPKYPSLKPSTLAICAYPRSLLVMFLTSKGPLLSKSHSPFHVCHVDHSFPEALPYHPAGSSLSLSPYHAISVPLLWSYAHSALSYSELSSPSTTPIL
jgi:hypothetical protein